MSARAPWWGADMHNCHGGENQKFYQPNVTSEPGVVVAHTCPSTVSKHSGMDGNVYFRADGGAWKKLDNEGNDRETGHSDYYLVPTAGVSKAEIKTTSDDGWCTLSHAVQERWDWSHHFLAPYQLSMRPEYGQRLTSPALP